MSRAVRPEDSAVCGVLANFALSGLRPPNSLREDCTHGVFSARVVWNGRLDMVVAAGALVILCVAFAYLYGNRGRARVDPGGVEPNPCRFMRSLGGLHSSLISSRINSSKRKERKYDLCN